MTIEKTIGVMGNFADVDEAWTWLVLQGPLTDRYKFTIISNTTDDVFAFGVLNSNGYDVLFTSNNKHYGDPTKGWKTNLTNGIALEFRGHGNGGSVVLDGLNIERIAGARVVFMLMGNHGIMGTTTEYITKNCLFKGLDKSGGGDTVIDILRDSDIIKMSYCKIYNMRNGLRFNINTGSGGFKTQDKIFEDIDIYNCYTGVRISTLFNFKVRMRNIVAGGSENKDWTDDGGNLSDWNLYSCADSDDSMSVIAFNVNNNPQPNIIPADEYISLNLDSGFLKLKRGIYFPGGIYTPGSLRLGQTGVPPTLSLTEDIAGESVPGVDGSYSIGSHQQLYEIVSGSGEMANFIGDAKYIFDSKTGKTDVQIADNRDLVQDQGFETAILVSIGTDRRALDEDVIPDGTENKRGWWGDVLNSDGDKIGSRRWLLYRSKLTDDTMNSLEEYDLEALQWMIDDGVASSIVITVTKVSLNKIQEVIQIFKPEGDPLTFKYFFNWEKQISGSI